MMGADALDHEARCTMTIQKASLAPLECLSSCFERQASPSHKHRAIPFLLALHAVAAKLTFFTCICCYTVLCWHQKTAAVCRSLVHTHTLLQVIRSQAHLVTNTRKKQPKTE